MLKKLATGLLLSVAIAASGAANAAQDPTLHQVYQAANAGRLNDAQQMMDQVLRDHPNSAKAHYVEAELLARQGREGGAAAELRKAEQLQPGLPFAKPESVQALRSRIAGTRGAVVPAGYAVQRSHGTPWGAILLGLGLVAAIVFAFRAYARRNRAVPYPGGANRYGSYGSGYPNQPYPQAYGGMGAPMGMAGGGLGSGIMGGLATGAAVGAGMVAGEALVHHFIDDRRPDFGSVAPVDNTWEAQPDTMGGNDFGIADNGSWGDGGGDWGMGDDWS